MKDLASKPRSRTQEESDGLSTHVCSGLRNRNVICQDGQEVLHIASGLNHCMEMLLLCDGTISGFNCC